MKYINKLESVFPQPVAICFNGFNDGSVLRQIGLTNDENVTSVSKRNNAMSLYLSDDL